MRSPVCVRLTKESLEAQFGTMPQIDGYVVGALYNSDTDSRKEVLVHNNPAGIIAGLKIAATLTDAKGAVPDRPERI